MTYSTTEPTVVPMIVLKKTPPEVILPDVKFKEGQDVYNWARASRDKETRCYHVGCLASDIDNSKSKNGASNPFRIQDQVAFETASDIVNAVQRDLERNLLTTKVKRLSKNTFAYYAERLCKI